jgi:Predicted 3'-5' exonuclease related to the exonuclease domain of PolB
MKPSVIVWDLETVPDLSGFAAANDLVGKSDVEVREAIGEKFPKHIYHSIICIGALIAHWEFDHWVVDAIGAPHVGERTEKELITAFCDKIAALSPQLVTFNGTASTYPCCATGRWSSGYPRRRSARVLTFIGTPRMPSICVMLLFVYPAGKGRFTRSAESWACLESRKGSMAARWSAISARARSRRSPTTARPMWSALTRYELFRGTLSQGVFDRRVSVTWRDS